MAKFTDEQVVAALRGARALRVVPFPGKTDAGTIAVRLLTEQEIDAARLEAQVKLRTFCQSRGWDPVSMVDIDPLLLQRYTEREIVWSAFYDAATVSSERPERYFPTPTDVAQLDATTVTQLMQQYEEHQLWVAPLRSLSEEDQKEFVQQLGNESSAPPFLHNCERTTLVRFVISMASALRSSISPTSK